MNVLFQLAARPDLADILREEVEGVLATETWSKEATDKMYKLDSFMKECQRMYSVASGQCASTLC